MSLHHHDHDTGHDIVIDIDNAPFLAPSPSYVVKMHDITLGTYTSIYMEGTWSSWYQIPHSSLYIFSIIFGKWKSLCT